MSEPLITNRSISDMLQAHEPFNATSHAVCAHRAQTVAQAIRDRYETRIDQIEQRVKALETEMAQNRGEL